MMYSDFMKQLFVDSREPRLKSDDLLNVSMSLEVDANQKAQAAGIIADIWIENSNEKMVSLLNPFEMLQFLLVDEAGFPLKLPQKPPNLLIISKNRKWKFDVAFPVANFFENGQEVSLSEIEKEILVLPGNGWQKARFIINRIIDSEQELPLPTGTYGIQCVGPLINAENREDSRALESPRVTVQFTQPSSAKP
jgi:hypothetical protein